MNQSEINNKRAARSYSEILDDFLSPAELEKTKQIKIYILQFYRNLC